MNQLQIIGNLTRDAELKPSQNGDNYLSFAVAVNQGKDQQALFVNVRQKQYANSSNALQQYLLKGKKVFVQGRISLSVYQSKQDNSWVPDLTLWADKIELCGGNDQQQQPASPAAPAQQGNVTYMNRPQAAQPSAEEVSETDDLPF